MIDHTGFAVSDLERAKAFYTAAFKPLSISLIMEVTAEETGSAAAAGFGKDGSPSSGSAPASRRAPCTSR